MKKKLLFAAVLLAPSAAYSANPSADLSVQVVPPSSNGIACDIGPKYTGAIPAAATQAGFTHCAANYDFTQTASFTDSKGTHTWSSLPSWFTCQNGNAPSPFLFNHQTNGVEVGCDTSHQNIVTDNGTQVLALSYYLTDANSGVYSNSLWTACCGGNVPPYGYDFPQESYVEQVFRQSQINTCGSCLTWAPFYYSSEANTNQCFVEEDFGETGGTIGGSGGGTNTAFGIWNPTCRTGGHASGPTTPIASATNGNTLSYSTFGSLWTADNVNTFAACNYWSAGVVSGLTAGTFKSCTTMTVVPPSTSPVFASRLALILDEGPESTGQGGSTWTATSHTTYLQRMTVWTCSNWQTGQCFNNPVITTHP